MKNILIVGASNGIGKKIAEILAQQSDNFLYLTYYQTPITFHSTNIKFFYYDATSEENNLLENIHTNALHGLVYCPCSIILKPFNRITAKEFLDDYHLQVLGCVKTLQKVFPLLTKEQSSVVLFSSVAASIGMPFHSVVSTHKAAIVGMAKALAAELAPKVRVNVIAPSLVNTSLAQSIINTESKIKNLSEKHPLKRIGTVEDIAELACFLLSEKSSWITGEVIHCDGGMANIKL